MLAVLDAYRHYDIGGRLKQAQRERALALGIREITWTFDPLQSRNAHLNFAKLGVVSDSYKVDFYGTGSTSMLPRNSTDRLWVRWLLHSRRVRDRLSGKTSRAETLDAMRLLARIAEARGILDDAETILEALIEFAPDSKPARLDYARIISLRQRYTEARAQLEGLLKTDPRNFEYRSLATSIAIGLGEYETAIPLCDELLAEVPEAANIVLWKGHALKTTGR